MTTLSFCITVLAASVGLTSVLLLLAMLVVASKSDQHTDRLLREMPEFRCERRSHSHSREMAGRR